MLTKITFSPLLSTIYRYGLKVVFSFTLIGISNIILAQGIPSNFGNFSGSNGGSGSPQEAIEVDTFGVYYVYSDNPGQQYAFRDTLLHHLQFYNPVRQRLLDYANLGNVGSAHQALFYESPFRQGLDIGLHQYDLYQINTKQVRFYRLEKAFTNVFYSQGADQSDSYLKAQFSRNFGKTLNLSLDYSRISQLGSSNQYPYQNGRNIALAVGLWYHSKNKRYQGFFNYNRNLVEQEDNGGIAQEPALDTEFTSPSSAIIFLINEAAKTRYYNQALAYTQYYNLVRTNTSTTPLKRAITLSHKTLYKTSEYKSFDLQPDSNFYKNLFTYEKGLRHFIGAKQLENTFKISTYQPRADSTNSKSINQRDLLELGLHYTLNNVNQEPLDTTINNLFLTGRFNFSPSKRLNIKTYAHLGLLDQAGDFRLSGDLTFDLARLGKLELKAINQAYTPTLIQQQAFISQRSVWTNDFKKTIETKLSAAYTIPKVNTQLMANYSLIDNYIYFDALSVPQQREGVINVLQFIAQQNIRVGKLNLDNTLVFQETTGDEIRTPRLFSKHSLYLSGKLFRDALEAQLGADLRMNTPFFANYYMPLTGQFILQNQQEVQFYPIVDVFFNAKIDRFRAFLKFENITNLISDNFYYQTAYNPQSVFTFRFGIFWRFIN